MKRILVLQKEEAACGNRHAAFAQLAEVVNRTVAHGGAVIVPPGQSLLYGIHLLEHRHAIPNLPVYLPCAEPPRNGGAEERLVVLSSDGGVAVGPVRAFVNVRSLAAAARRGKGHPPGAHSVAVAAARRLHCAARSEVAPPNSLRSLRSLRSNNRGESDDKARWRAPTPTLRCSSPPKSRPAGNPCREVHEWSCSLSTPPPCLQSGVRTGRSAPLERREAQGLWPRAQRASMTDSSRLFERNERSECSEFGDGAMRPMHGAVARSDDRSSEARRPARTSLCRANRRMQRGRSKTATGRERIHKTAAFHASRVARSAVEQFT